MKLRCPRCGKVYEVDGAPPENPGGLGARAGWTCIFCTDEPPAHVRIQYAAALKNPFAACWHPVYLEPYDGNDQPCFAIFRDQGAT